MTRFVSMIFIVTTILFVDGCQIGPRNFGFDLSMFKSAQYFRFMEHFEQLGLMNRAQFIDYLKKEVAPTAPLYEFTVQDFILNMEMAKNEARFELFRLRQLLSPEAFRLAEKIYNLEIDDRLICFQRTLLIFEILNKTPSNITEEYQTARKRFEDDFNSKRYKIMMMYESDV